MIFWSKFFDSSRMRSSFWQLKRWVIEARTNYFLRWYKGKEGILFLLNLETNKRKHSSNLVLQYHFFQCETLWEGSFTNSELYIESLIECRYVFVGYICWQENKKKHMIYQVYKVCYVLKFFIWTNTIIINPLNKYN